MRLPLIQPDPPRLSAMADALRAVEESGVFSNGGPAVRRFEHDIVARMFGGQGAALATNNATIALMLALRQAATRRPRTGRLALMTSFTFAAAAHAAEWAGLTPLLCDCDPDDWTASAAEEERLLALHGDRIAAIVPYAAFGTDIDLDRYARLAKEHGVAVVVDAAASLGTIDAAGRGFGTGCAFPVVFSMHATKPFGIAEGGLVYSADEALIEALRRMGNYGFGGARAAETAGLNAKLPEVLAVMAQAKLETIEADSAHRAALEAVYRAELDGFALQRPRARRQAMQFMPVLLPAALAPKRAAIVAALAERGIGSGSYFSPHLAQQPHFAAGSLVEPTPVADAIGARMISLPLTDRMTEADARAVARALRRICAEQARTSATIRNEIVGTLVVGGGPAGSALLIAAARQKRLETLARSGFVLIEKSAKPGAGALEGYAIPSDSTAETFLTAVRADDPDLAGLLDGEPARRIAAQAGGLGVPLHEVGPFLRAVTATLAQAARRHGGSVLTGHEVIGARRTAAGHWRAEVRRPDGTTVEMLARNIVVATGGEQTLTALQHEQVAGASLLGLAGDRLVRSDELLALGGIEALRARLADRRSPRIAVIGGSTSALAAVSLILKAAPALPLAAGAVSLLHRRPLRPFYPSAEAARADGYDDFGADDICPVSGFVYRLGGFRLDARELVLRMLRVGGREPDPRVALHRLGEDDAGARALIDRADLVIAALGYRPRALPLFGVDGRPIALQADAPGRAAMVDGQCRLLDAAGRPITNAFGIGLAAGFVPSGALGGEASFAGQANGLWLWQNDVGAMILDQIDGTGAQAGRAAA